jgi:hypothetical protein
MIHCLTLIYFPSNFPASGCESMKDFFEEVFKVMEERFLNVMEQRLLFYAVFLGLGMYIFLTGSIAMAALGECADSVISDRKNFSAVQRAPITRNGYTIQEFQSGANVVREFISPTGVVFAVAWNGLSHPDLTTLLGNYLDEYREALRQTPRERGRRQFKVKTNGVVVEKWGHMRSVHGRAYIPALIPSGVSIDEIK